MAKFRAHGVDVTIGGTDIAGLTSIVTPDRQKGEGEITDNKSGGNREFLPGLRDNGTLDLEFRTDVEDAGQVALRDNLEGDATAQVVITLPPAAATTTPVTFTFDAFVTNFQWGEFPQADDEPASGSATLRVSGAITFDVGV